MRRVDTVEFGVIGRLSLDLAQRDALLGCGGDIAMAPETGTSDLWTLRTGSFVGVAVVPGLELRIRPKLPVARLFVMLSAAAGSIQWSGAPAGLAQSSEVEDIVAVALADSIRRCLRTGLLRGYVAIEEESHIARGALDLAETLRRRPATLAPLVQTPEHLDVGVSENRVIASALSHLVRRVHAPATRVALLQCQRYFAEVPAIPPGCPLPRLARNRLNSRWWGTIELAMLVLRSCGLDLPAGAQVSRSFLVDMNAVFETFVFRALADELGAAGRELHSNRGGIRLDVDGNHTVRPDLSLWAGPRCVFAGDCKYKSVGEAGAQRDDVYQCLAYAAATGLDSVMLVYGGGSIPSRNIQIVDRRTLIKARVLNLAAPIHQLRGQFALLADEIRAGAQGPEGGHAGLPQHHAV